MAAVSSSSAAGVWLASGVRSPFAKVDGALAGHDAISLSVPVVKAMLAKAKPDFAVWGTVIPNLTWSNLAREVLLDAGGDPTIPAFSTVMACSTSMIAAIEAAGMVDVYRAVHPDPVAVPGDTWTPTPGLNEVHDRIDLLYALTQLPTAPESIPVNALVPIKVRPWPTMSEHPRGNWSA